MKTGLFQFRAFLVACVLACGATAFIGVIVAFAVGIYRATFVDEGPTVYLNFRGNGEPYLVRFDSSRQVRTQTDLDGNPISLEDETEYTREVILPAGLPPADPDEREPWHSRIIGFMDNRQPPNYWYLMHDGLAAGHAYFVGYSAANRDRVGYIGTAGFRQDPVPPAEQFPVHSGLNWNRNQVACDSGTYNMARAPQGILTPNGRESLQSWMVYLNAGSKVYEVNLATREARSILADSGSSVLNIGIGAHGGNTIQRESLAMRTADEVHFFHPDGSVKKVPLAPELQGRGLQIVERPEGDYTVAATTRVDYPASRQYLKVYVMAADGTLSPPRETFETVSSYQDTFVYEAPLVTGSPAMLAASLVKFRTRELLHRDLADNFGEALRLAFRQYALYFLATIAAGAALAIACYRRQMLLQTPLRERIVWPIFVFLFGVPGWIGYRYCRRWPVVEPCPACHEPSPRDDEVCAVCGREFPLPEPKGTEIFA